MDTITFKVGDRIKAIAGVCPGHFGLVTGIARRDMGGTVYYVTYDSYRTDVICGKMIELVQRRFEDPYETDE